MQTFEELGLSGELIESLSKSSILTPTEIQRLVIPILLDTQTDLIGLAQTGTGKTAAFGLPMLDLIAAEEAHTQAVVLAPTRELAQQIAKSLKDFSTFRKDIKIEVVYGGAPIMNQIKSIKKTTPHILVATPGRLKDLLKRKVIFFDNVQTFVLDEADEMLNMGFKEDIYDILSYSDQDRNIWLFSATMAADIRAIIKDFMHKPVEFSVNASQKINSDIDHQVCVVKAADKQAALERFIDFLPNLYGVVFCRTKRDTQKLADSLNKSGYAADALHGDLNQNQRDAVMKRFRNRQTKLLIATDVAARGIDVEDLTHVFHFALPDDMAFYTHRSGRTARAGKKGLSLSIMTAGEERKLRVYAKKLKFDLSQIDVPNLKDVKKQRILAWQEKLKKVEVSPALDDNLRELSMQFMEQMGPEAFLEKVISLELNKLKNLDEKEFRATKTAKSTKPAQSNKKAQNNKRAKGSGNYADQDSFRFFINIGKMDQTNKSELVEFICDIGKVDKQHIGNIAMEQRFSYFDLDPSKVNSFAERFKNLEIDGRELRVNRDFQNDQKRKRKK